MNFPDRFRAGPPDPPSLQLLFTELPVIPAEHFTAMLRAYHPDLASAAVELHNVSDLPGSDALVSGDGPPATSLGLVSWGPHVIRLASFAAPMPAAAIEAAIQAALLPPEVKADARAHQAHVLLYYAGEEPNALEQLVALAAVAGVLAEFGAIVTLNEEARAAILSTDLLPDADGEDMMVVLRSMPLPYLYAGFVKLTLSDSPGVWMRTFAAPRLGLPNLAYRARSHDEGQSTFHLFTALLGYLKETGLKLEAGETIRLDEDKYYCVQEPGLLEWWLESAGEMWVVEAGNRV